MSRSTAEWIGKTDDSRPPAYVRLRVFDRYKGICYLSNTKIEAGDKWDLEHIIALCNGGENREDNLAPALKSPHKIKTKSDRRLKSKNDRVRKKHIGKEAERQYNSLWREVEAEWISSGGDQ